ncbi:UDP-4-amino-4,6-dideoxy-N-acetyl-beta-L-altrosamine transaminase [Methylophaga sp.]|uniref:UDP-4-amino-4, 6-dideoxy-N-acetyl-beta-L-altrosamine transaminase n=1 Tax=Methylophaga sp. TaxID=2024840 RepID=UPI003A8CE523
MIPYGRQHITVDDIRAVTEVLQSEFLTQGPVVPRFEALVADYCRARYAVAANSATSALHLACLALGLGKGDLLWTVPTTFVASANCALYCGADVDFVDIDPHTYTMSVEALKEKLEVASRERRLPKIVVPVHLCGQPADMMAIKELAEKYDFRIIEDASHAIGGSYKGEPIGCCSYSDITVFSFHPVKIITTGEGGMALTNEAALARKMELQRSHGITRDPELMTHEPEGPWYYQQIDIGFNYRMTEINAALGCSQMARLDQYVARRHVLAKRYDRALSDLPVRLPWQAPDSYSAYHLYVIRLQSDQCSVSHLEVFTELRNSGVGVNLHYIPVHMQPYYQRMGFKSGDFPESERYYAEAISLPLFPALSYEEQEIVVGELRRIVI